jgi:hypothetical protein
MKLTNICIALSIDRCVTFAEGRIGRILKCATVSYRLIERPSLKRRRHLEPLLFTRTALTPAVPKQPAHVVASLLLCVAVTGLTSACAARHGAPVVDTGEKPPEVTGTISGIVRAAGSNAPLSARRVTAIDVSTGARIETSTAANGGYTMKVPAGRYRLQVELGPNESIAQAPDEVVINRSDVDSGRDFLIAMKR